MMTPPEVVALVQRYRVLTFLELEMLQEIEWGMGGRAIAALTQEERYQLTDIYVASKKVHSYRLRAWEKLAADPGADEVMPYLPRPEID